MPELPRWISSKGDGALVRLQVQPGASRSEIAGEYGTGEAARLKIRIAAPPVDNAANEELIHFLKKKAGVPSSKVHVLRGATSKTKDVLIEGIAPEALAARLSTSAPR